MFVLFAGSDTSRKWKSCLFPPWPEKRKILLVHFSEANPISSSPPKRNSAIYEAIDPPPLFYPKKEKVCFFRSKKTICRTYPQKIEDASFFWVAQGCLDYLVSFFPCYIIRVVGLIWFSPLSTGKSLGEMPKTMAEWAPLSSSSRNSSSDVMSPNSRYMDPLLCSYNLFPTFFFVLLYVFPWIGEGE